jgi:hypothetical protein
MPTNRREKNGANVMEIAFRMTEASMQPDTFASVVPDSRGRSVCYWPPQA